MKKGEKRAESSSEKNYVIPVADGAREGLLVGIKSEKNAVEERGRVILGFHVAIEFEEFGKEGEDEGKRYLGKVSNFPS